ncbi:MAG: DUF3108 domain-containing protein [Bacteroidota bacterium]|nr:DUF3108 domain-containing protein [Bacteroidota bacterium]
MRKIIKASIFSIVILFVWAFTTKVEQADPFTTGEKLEYRVHYGMMDAAKISMTIDTGIKNVNGKNTIRIMGDGKTLSGYDWFFKVRDHYETFIDTQTNLPVKYIRNVQEGGYKDVEHATFDHRNNKIYSSKGIYKSDGASFQDVLSAIYYLRGQNLKNMKKGDKIKVKFYLDKKIYESEVTIGGREVIKTSLGKFNTIILKPNVVVDRVFPNKDALTIWATDDANLIPLRIKTELMVGSIKADITKITGNRNPLTSKIK